ncbi:hypothetical protein [Legionella bononiensis]|uniref:Uncharacterized protein n=1 Tax=Legionella bononiensis TaxID=2793102 RepID=A0ABS1WFX5_9GAMM|nr:hypothetical protein [Legionella bononiensis]MBL7481703.1 hypothetical protein [Legionella bononiensis]MBL7528251.1 hypothetical protein [Legionella bononiensis]MBL7562726.1 hypothetical protein [Legionella bononiensis]
MWSIINEWFKRNKPYLTMLFLSSLAVGLLVASLSIIFPSVLVAFSSLTLFGIVPLAFLTTLNAPLAVFTLSAIMMVISAGVIAPGIMIGKQLTTIGIHIYSLFAGEENQEAEDITTNSYDYLNKYLQPESYEYVEEDDDEEFHELVSDSSSDDEIDCVPLFDSQVNDAVETNSLLTMH